MTGSRVVHGELEPGRTRDDRYEHLEPLLAELADLGAATAAGQELRARIIHLGLPLAEHIARRFAGRGEAFDDLLQVARVGLLHAVDRFDPARGSGFLAFAVPTIMGEVRRHFRDRTWPVRVNRTVKETQSLLAPAIEAFAQRMGRTPSMRELATELGTDLATITQGMLAANCYQADSLDATVPDESGAALPLVERIGADEHCYGLIEDALSVRPLIAELPERDRQILIWRFCDSLTQQQIAERLEISQMQVSRVLARILAHIRTQAFAPPEAVPAR
ncbi:SigB/SigF/SigG family RNA polymerase sigma factor [Nocardia sp. NPDC048505]|uniref:SigB/SigF/SigG family RNA polymerase sigma factor n=1 Tax=unclassified Nocardia TaxID=2637762 RepID=UPI0033D884D6